MEWQQNRLQLYTNQRMPWFHQHSEDWGLLALCVLHYLQYTQLSSWWFRLTQIIKSNLNKRNFNIWPFDCWTRFRNYIIFRNNSIENCRSVLFHPVAFKIVQHFEVTFNLSKSSDSIVRVTKYISNGLVLIEAMKLVLTFIKYIVCKPF